MVESFSVMHFCNLLIWKYVCFVLKLNQKLLFMILISMCIYENFM